jgi:hypothetical protein
MIRKITHFLESLTPLKEYITIHFSQMISFVPVIAIYQMVILYLWEERNYTLLGDLDIEQPIYLIGLNNSK